MSDDRTCEACDGSGLALPSLRHSDPAQDACEACCGSGEAPSGAPHRVGSHDRAIEAMILASITVPEGVTVVVADPFITVSGERDMRAALTPGDMLLATPLAPGNPFLPEPRKLRVGTVTKSGAEVVPHDAPRNRAERRKAASRR